MRERFAAWFRELEQTVWSLIESGREQQ